MTPLCKNYELKTNHTEFHQSFLRIKKIQDSNKISNKIYNLNGLNYLFWFGIGFSSPF